MVQRSTLATGLITASFLAGCASDAPSTEAEVALGTAEQALSPIGWLDFASPSGIQGWACDHDDPDTSINVRLAFGGPLGGGAKLTQDIAAGDPSEQAVFDACRGGYRHRFNWAPTSDVTGQLGPGNHPVYAYGLDPRTGEATQMGGGPRTLTLSSPDRAPVGYLDYVGEDYIYGWTCDLDTPNLSNRLHVYFGGPSGGPAKTMVGFGRANRMNGQAVTDACGGGPAHRFNLKIPREVKTTLGLGDFSVYAYGLNTLLPSTTSALLNNSPKTMRITRLPDPVIHKPYPHAGWSPYCDRGIDNLCNVPELGRNCQSGQQWTDGYYDYQKLCNQSGGADYICTRGVDNLCDVGELGRQCATSNDWLDGWYDYQELCSTRGATCGSQPQQLTGTLTTAKMRHPGLARTDPDFNIEVFGYRPAGDAREFSNYGGCADYSAPNLTDLWPGRARPEMPFGQQYRLNQPGQEGALVTGLRVTPCQDVYLPSTGLPGEMGPGMASCAEEKCKGNDAKGPYEEWVPHPRKYINGAPPSSSDDFQALVIYADASTVTVQYTLNDGPFGPGYVLYVDNLDVNPAIISAYQAANARGRDSLPALPPGARLGKARGDEIRVVFRDTASWMDARSRKDWWADEFDRGATDYACWGD